MVTDSQISKREDRERLFGVRAINEDGLVALSAVRDAYNALLDVLEAHALTKNREFSIVRTKLEEALMYTSKTISLDPRYQL